MSDEKKFSGVKMKIFRERAGLSQFTLGELVGLSRQQILCYENGVNIPSADRLAALAGALRVNLDELFVTPPTKKSRRAA